MGRARRAWTRAVGARAEGVPAATVARAARPQRRVARDYTAQAMLERIAQTRHLDDQIPDRQEIAIDPVPKPRMTRTDVWKPRACVRRYYDYRTELQLRRVRVPHRYSLEFHVPMPTSWPEAKRAALDGQPALSAGDTDNYGKAFTDALLENDAAHWDGRCRKFWARVGRVVVLKLTDAPAPAA